MTLSHDRPQSQKSCLIECDLTMKKKHKHTQNIEEDKEEGLWSSDHYAQEIVKLRKRKDHQTKATTG